MTIGKRMFDIMTKKDLRPTDLSRFLGISTSSVSNWKIRGTDPPSEYLLPICEFIGIDIGELLGGAPATAQKTSSDCPRELARTAFFEKLTEEHISLIHCYCALTPDEQAGVWHTIMRMQELKKGSSSDSRDDKKADPPDATTA